MDSITQIQLLGPNGGFLDLEKETAAPLTIAIAEIRDITKKKGTFSKSITLAHNDNNAILLNHYYDLNIQANTFDINKLSYCNIIQNGVSILDNALLQLVDIDKSQDDNNKEDKITYTVLIKDSTSDFFTNISNKYLTDLSGFTWMNHQYTADNVIASFSHTVADGYKYVMPFNPESSSNYNDAMFDLKEFTPGIYAKTYMDKIFQNAGYSYYWPDMDNEEYQFSKLIIPWNGDVLKSNLNESEETYVEAARTGLTQTNPSISAGIPFNLTGKKQLYSSLHTKLSLPIEISDASGIYNPATSVYLSPDNPSSENKLEYEYDVEYEVVVINDTIETAYARGFNRSTGTIFSLMKMAVSPKIEIKQTSLIPFYDASTIVAEDTITEDRQPIYINNGTSYAPLSTTVIGSGFTTVSNTVDGINPFQEITLQSYLNIGNTLNTNTFVFMFQRSTGDDLPTVKIELRVKNMTMRVKTLINGEYGFNTQVQMQRYIPEKIKQGEFVKSIFTMFNLFAEVDKTNQTRINIVGRDKYYDDGKITNWTDKLVKEEKQNIKFIPEITKKKMLLTYKEDKDKANEIYKQATNEVYGQQEFVFDNEYVKEIDKQELIFSPTPMFNTSFGAVSPMWVGGAPKVNIRILIDGGEYPTSQTYSIANYWFDSTSNSIVTGNTYPHISHWNKPINPTFDINFGVCDYYFRSDNYGSDTNNNLFNLHWRRTINQINSGKLLTAYFQLNEVDIINLKLSDKIRIDNSWWNINKIIDYDANSNSPTKVELISIDDTLKIPFERKETVVKLKADDESLVIPRTLNSGVRNNFLSNIQTAADVTVKGKYNYITKNVTDATVFGSNNFVGDNAVVYGSDNIVNSEAIIFGQGNTINEDVTGSVIVLGDNFVVSSGNTLYTENIVTTSGGTINGVPVANINGINYVRGWEGESENGNVVSIGKSQGQLVLTSGSTTVTGIDTLFTNTDLDGLNSGFGFLSVFLPNGELIYIELDSVTNDTEFELFEIFNNSTSTTDTEWVYDDLITDWWYGKLPIASGVKSFAIGDGTVASGNYSHAEGFETQANGLNSHAEGFETQANGLNSHAEGDTTIADNTSSHAEGSNTQANGTASHSEGVNTIANGDYSHAQGANTVANGEYSHVANFTNTASTYCETVIGIYSEEISGDTQSVVPTEPIFRVGIGTSTSLTKDGLRLYKNGAAYLSPQPLSGITNGDNGFLAYNEATDKLASHDGSNWGDYAKMSDLTLASSPVWKKSGLSINADSSSEKIYRTNNAGLVGTSVSYATGPTQADIDNETLGTSFGHVFGGGTSGFIQLLGNGNNGGNPNVFIGTNSNGSATSQLTFTSVSGNTYAGWGTDKNLFRFKNGYLTGNDTLVDIGTERNFFYKETNFEENIRIKDSVNYVEIRPEVSGLTSNRLQTLIDTDGKLPIYTSVPSSASDTGVVGQIAADANFIYVCIATDTWVRSSAASW